MNQPAAALPLGVILAGGASRRFGAPKALATVGGRTLSCRVRDALREAGAEVRAVTGHPEWFSGLGVPTRPDAVAGLGALGGILTALRWAAEEERPGTLVVACDLPFVAPALLRALLEAGATGATAVVPESHGRRGFEPLCAWYGTGALPEVEAMAAAGERRAFRIAERVAAVRIPLNRVAATGDPSVLFLNVNTVDQLRAARRSAGDLPPAVSIVGRKNSGKTTLTVALAAELKRRGRRIATIKHGHHAFEVDQPGKDSWRHFHEGGAEAVVMAGAGKVALVMRTDEVPGPEALVQTFYAGRGYDLVLVEGFKHGPLPRVEVHRRGQPDGPVHDPADADAAARYLAVVSDDPELRARCPVIPLDPADPQGTHVARVADLLEAQFLGDLPHG